MKKRIFRFLLPPVIIVAALYGYASYYDTPPPTKTFIDRQGKVIGTVDSTYQGFQILISLDDLSPKVSRRLVDKTLESEDRFFYWHPGINPVSVLKAAITNIFHGRIIRGGSTITQQLAKNLIQEKESSQESSKALKPLRRTFANKIRETFLALGLEIKHSKKWILERYLNSIYYGHRTYGFASAAQNYLGKNPSELSDEEIDFLITLPKAPGKMTQGLSVRYEKPIAQHLMDFLKTRSEIDNVAHTTIDRDLQASLENAVQATLASRLEKDPLLTAAVVVIDVKTGDLLSLVGSRDYFDEKISGQYNAAVALRQPGSTLKPFTYFAAFLKGYSPETVISDSPTSFHVNEENVESVESYSPQNFDRRYHGDVTIRQALANSYNVPAVVTLNDLGLSYYHELLKKFGFVSLKKAPSYYGLAVTLGAGEVSLLELTNAYAALARGGRFLPVRFLAREPKNTPKEVSSESSINASVAAAQITGILSDPEARLKAFGFNENLVVEGHDVAVKTGTSYEHRDNWTVGYTPSYAVGVWVGHADDTPMDLTTGATGAGPVWHAVMENILRGKPNEKFILPQNQGENPSAFGGPDTPHRANFSAKYIEVTQEKSTPKNWKILSPVSYSRFRLNSYLPKDHQNILATGQSQKNVSLRWYLDGQLIEKTVEAKPRVWISPTLGRHVLKIESDTGEKQEIPFFVLENDL